MDLKLNKQVPIDLFFLGFIAIAALSLKLFYANCQTEDLKLFLKPVSMVVSFFTGASYHFSGETGYLFPSLNITIERSCSGVNFFVMAFCMVSISTLPFYKTAFRKTLALTGFTFAAFLFTILANSSRIIIAVNSLRWSDIFYTLGTDDMHLYQGSFIYLFFLILFYFLAFYSNKKITRSLMNQRA